MTQNAEPNPLTPFPYKEGGTENGERVRRWRSNTVGGVEPFKGSTDVPGEASLSGTFLDVRDVPHPDPLPTTGEGIAGKGIGEGNL